MATIQVRCSLKAVHSMKLLLTSTVLSGQNYNVYF